MGNYNFRIDLSETQKKEVIAVTKMTQFYDTKQVGEFGEDSRWDFIMTSTRGARDKTFEMKSDSKTHETGNVIIEYESRGKPSGISTSKSDYYLYEVEKPDSSDYYLIPTEKIRELIKNHMKSQFYVRTVVGGDVGSQTKMYLIRLAVFARHAKLLKFH